MHPTTTHPFDVFVGMRHFGSAPTYGAAMALVRHAIAWCRDQVDVRCTWPVILYEDGEQLTD